MGDAVPQAPGFTAFHRCGGICLLSVRASVLSRREEYVELGGNYYDQRNQSKVISRLVARLNKLGCSVDVRLRRRTFRSSMACWR